MKTRAGAFLAVFGTAATASANGAMGLGLEMFDLHYWFAYVVAMVVLEAWLMGRLLGVHPLPALGISILANLFTGVMCGGMGCFAPFLHGVFVGSSANPSPFLNAVALLTAFALPSAYLESIVWRLCLRRRSETKFIKWSFAVHLLTVPLGLAILLIPEHPYKGLEGTAGYSRRMLLISSAKDAASRYIAEKSRIPTATSVTELASELEEFRPNRRMWGELKFAFYEALPRSRFSLGSDPGKPFEINKEIVGRKIINAEGEVDEKWAWWVRPQFDSSGKQWGLIIDLNSGLVRYTSDAKELGYNH